MKKNKQQVGLLIDKLLSFPRINDKLKIAKHISDLAYIESKIIPITSKQLVILRKKEIYDGKSGLYIIGDYKNSRVVLQKRVVSKGVDSIYIYLFFEDYPKDPLMSFNSIIYISNMLAQDNLSIQCNRCNKIYEWVNNLWTNQCPKCYEGDKNER